MMKLQFVKTSLVATVIALISGCASVVTDSATAINVQTTNGKEAKVFVDGQPYQVPGVVMAKKDGQDKIVTVEGEGCAKSTVIPKQIETAFWGNILIGGFLGSTTDSATDKMWTYNETVTIDCSGS